MTPPLFDRLRAIQKRLERFYQLERAPDVTGFVRDGEPESRETVLIRQSAEALELAVVLPPETTTSGPATGDFFLQLVEGVSHFVYLAERARVELPATRLELELQAEVDKFALLALDGTQPLEPARARTLHGKLYERVRHLHEPDTEKGERYRLANDLAARLVARLLEREDREGATRALRRFYRSGQTDKIRFALAA